MKTETLFCPPPKSFPVTLGDLTFCVQSYQITGLRLFSEQTAADGTTHLTNTAQRARRIQLTGTWVTDTDPSDLILLLDNYLNQNTGFPLTLGRVQFPMCQIARYTASESGTSPLLTGKLELIAVQPPQEVTAHV